MTAVHHQLWQLHWLAAANGAAASPLLLLLLLLLLEDGIHV